MSLSDISLEAGFADHSHLANTLSAIPGSYAVQVSLFVLIAPMFVENGGPADPIKQID